ncbi:heparan-alpha-glucosaminide N-acetyltransferase domain-containing protein [Niabella defluvii]|nr:heparan-alpha-glucosaminide N-acetyltransferase domain-containing protein [Niabella sp. I65]
MLLMVVDHVRVYSGIPAWGADPAIFFTRWITNFCAPGFAFFAGTSAYLYGQKVNSSGALSRFLFVRGLILIILELTVIHFFWSFNPNITAFILAGVIWMLGWSMIILGMLTRLRTSIILIIGIAMIAFQQIFQHVPLLLPQSARESFGKIWAFFLLYRL